MRTAIRLLYRLLRQNLDSGLRGAIATPTKATPRKATPPESGRVESRRRRSILLFFVMLAVGIAALSLVQWHGPTGPGQLGSPGAAATLTLRIDTVDTAPTVVFLTGNGLQPPPPDPAASSVATVRSVDSRFSPTFQIVSPASSIEISNDDVVPHNTHVRRRGQTVFNVALPQPGVTVRRDLVGHDIFTVHCDIHPSMNAALFTPPSPHYAVLEAPKTVELRDIPPGEYILHLWQPGRPEHLRPLQLAAGEQRRLQLR